MNDQIKIGIESWIDFMNLRYKAEKSLIDVVDKNELKFGNEALNELINNGVKFSRTFMETRYKLERELIGSLSKVDVSVEEEKEDGVSISKDEEPEVPKHSGLIRINVPQSGLVKFPIRLQNDLEDDQKIQVSVSDVINVETTKVVSGKIEVEESTFSISPKSESAANFSLLADGRIFKPGKNYAARIEIQGLEKKQLDVMVSVVKKGDDVKVSFEPGS